MHALDVLRTATEYHFGLLLEAHHELVSLNDSDRRAWTRDRIEFVKQCNGDFESAEMHTSGSTGPVRQYRFGPSYVEVMKFWNYLRTYGRQSGHTVFLNYHWPTPFDRKLRSEDHTFRTFNAHPTPAWAFSIRVDTQPDASFSWLLDHFKPTRSRPLEIVFSPSTISRLRLNLERIDPDSIIFVSTGAIADDDELSMLRKNGFDVRDVMRCWDGGATFVTCHYGSRHFIDVLSDTGHPADTGSLKSTCLINLAQKFIDHDNSDIMLNRSTGVCKCGMRKDDFQMAERRAGSVRIQGRTVDCDRIGDDLRDRFDDLMAYSIGFGQKTVVLWIESRKFDRGLAMEVLGKTGIQDVRDVAVVQGRTPHLRKDIRRYTLWPQEEELARQYINLGN